MLLALLLAIDLRMAAKPAGIARAPEHGKLRVINIWATWCVPCVHEMDDLRAVSDTFRPRGVEFVGVSMDDVLPGDEKATRAKVEKFLAQKAIRYPNYFYTGGQNALVEAFGFSGELPVTLVYDSKGKELFRVEGAIEKKKLTETLNQLLKR